jgi:hypothetical protein
MTMRTFKLWIRLTGCSVLIWLTTNILGSLLLTFSSAFTNVVKFDDMGLIITFSLVLSSPVILVMMLSLFIVTRIPVQSIRVVYAILSTLFICFGLLKSLSLLDLHMGSKETIMFFSPFIVSAVGMKLLWGRSFIFSPDKSIVTGNGN